MLTTLLVSAGSKVLGAFGSGKKSSSNNSSSSATSPGQASSPGSTSPGGASVPAGMQMRSGTVMEKKMTANGSETESIEIVDEG